MHQTGSFHSAARLKDIFADLRGPSEAKEIHYFLGIASSATVLDRFSSGDYEGIDEDDDFELPNTVGRSLDAEGVPP